MKKRYFVIIILLILIAIGGVVFFGKNNNIVDVKKDEGKIEDKVDKEKERQDQLVIRLIEEQIISYERTLFQQAKEENKYSYMFSNSKVDYNNMDNILKFVMVYRELLRTGYDDVKYYRFKYENDIDERYDYEDINNWEEIGENDYHGPYADYTTKVYYEITKEKIHEMARQMFGQDTLIDGDYMLSYVDACYFRNGEYFCHDIAGGGTGVDEYVTMLDHYEMEGEYLVIYQKAYWIDLDWETDKYNIAQSHDSEPTAQLDDYSFEFDETLYKKYGRIYKSIFRKNSEGNYYWISSEPIGNN